jgi:hypothetical protein
VDSHDSSTGEMQDTTDQSSANEKRSATETINEGKYKTGCDKEDNILDDGGCEGGVSSHSSHVEDVDEVVKHDIATPELKLVQVLIKIFRGKLTAIVAKSVH